MADLKSILDPVQAPNPVKAEAWDAFNAAGTRADFQARFDKIALPKETKAALWDAKFSGQPAQPPAQATPEGGPVSRFFGNLWDKTVAGATGTAKVLADIATHPPGRPFDPQGPTLGFLKNAIDAHHQQGVKAKEALLQGRFTEAASHLLAAEVPLAGPAAADAGEQIGGTEAQVDKFGNVVKPGKAPDIAGGLGSATALLAPMAAGPVVGKVAGKMDAGADAAAQSLAKKSLRGGYTVNTPAADVEAAASGMREMRSPLTPEGGAKIKSALTDVRQAIEKRVNQAAAQGVAVEPKAVVDRLDNASDRFAEQVNPQQDVRDFEKVRQNFLDNHTVTVPAKPASAVVGANGQPARAATPARSTLVPIPADQAQAIKVGSNTLNAEKYGKISTAQVEAEKALTRGIKEELEAQIPELGKLNASQAKLMNLDDILSKAVNKYQNSDGFTADLKTTNISAAALRSVIANPVLKARLALAIDTARRANPGKLGVPAVSGVARVNALIANLDSQQEQKQ